MSKNSKIRKLDDKVFVLLEKICYIQSHYNFTVNDNENMSIMSIMITVNYNFETLKQFKTQFVKGAR